MLINQEDVPEITLFDSLELHCKKLPIFAWGLSSRIAFISFLKEPHFLHGVFVETYLPLVPL